MKQPETLLEYLVQSERIVIFTGAGISTGAGIPDYRGPQGIWKTRPEISLQDFMFESEKREQYWTFKSEDWQQWQDVNPTPAHRAITRLHELGKLQAVLTQNIDGLHRKAGTPEEQLIELHGRMDGVICIHCGFQDQAQDWYTDWREHQKLPLCPDCQKYLKPAVIQFGEMLREEDMRRAQAAMQHPDLVIAIGSTLSVQPAATFPIMAARAGIPYIIINQGETAHDGMPHVALRLEGDVQEIFPPAVEDAGAMFG
ncbi:Sir2 family NAD-dependent protein deacetylase [Kiritimatiellaeota bacterium B1221]|nr:Sir2 family NAD-dependent protein deacetylase [Kiritimatiellaeota bacterium B1221]